MRARSAVPLVIGLVAVGAIAAAQVRPLPPAPDLSGTWVVASPTEGAAASPFGAQFVVKQDAATVTVTTDRETVTYRVDDSTNVRTTRTVTGASWKRTARARFVSAAMVVTTEIDAGATGHWEDLLVLSLDRPGELTVVTCNAVMSREPGMATRVFKYRRTE